MIDRIVTLLLFIIIAVLAIWLKILSRQVNILYEAYHKLCEVNEKQAASMKKIVATMQEQSVHTHDVIESFIDMINQAISKK